MKIINRITSSRCLLLLIFHIYFLIPLTGYAQEFRSDEDLTTTFTEDDLAEIEGMKEGAVLRKRDVKTGLFLEDYNTFDDKNRLSFLYHVNSDLTALTDIQTFEAAYAHRFSDMWIEFFGFRTTGEFKDLTANNPFEGAATEDVITSSDTVTAFGASISYRDSWIGHLLDTEKIFTTTAAGVGWYSFHQTFRDKTYAGPGLKADFGIHRRSTRTMHYGLKMSYHLASVKREAEFDEETSSARSHTLTWLTFGFDLSFYF
jgi:hypothetical protein